MVENVIIMAGGEGQRLRPLTEERPKPLMPLLDEPVIGMTLKLLRRYGMKRATLTVCYRADDIRHALKDGAAYGVALRYAQEDDPRGTAGSVRDAARSMSGTVLVMSGDGLTDIDLNEMWRRHVAGGATASLVLKRVENPGDYGVCDVDESGRIVRFREKPGDAAASGSLVNTGIYFLEQEALARIPDEGTYDFGRELFPAMLEAGVALQGLETDAYWCDIGCREAYAQAQMDLLMGKVGLPVRGRKMGSAIMAADSTIAPDVRITGRCYIGRNAQVGRGTVLGPGTVLNDGAQVGRNARLENACLWENARVDGGTILKNVVVVPKNGHQGIQRLVPYTTPPTIAHPAISARNGS